MSDPFWREHVKQDRLEEMYEIFRKRDDATEKNTAIHLARFAEAHIFNACSAIGADTAPDKRITELEAQLPNDEVRNLELIDILSKSAIL